VTKAHRAVIRAPVSHNRIDISERSRTGQPWDKPMCWPGRISPVSNCWYFTSRSTVYLHQLRHRSQSFTRLIRPSPGISPLQKPG
jgi:hypothetical protein